MRILEGDQYSDEFLTAGIGIYAFELISDGEVRSDTVEFVEPDEEYFDYLCIAKVLSPTFEAAEDLVESLYSGEHDSEVTALKEPKHSVFVDGERWGMFEVAAPVDDRMVYELLEEEKCKFVELDYLERRY